MSQLRVLATRDDGGVAIICPSARCVDLLCSGGGIACVAHSPHLGPTRWGLKAWLRDNTDPVTIDMAERTGYLPLDLAKAWEVEKYVRDAHWRADMSPAARQSLAREWIEAMAHGGVDEIAAVALIGRFSAPLFSTALETVDVSDLPTDTTHRNAWRRSPNGGPIWIDETAAQAIDEARAWSAYERNSA